jgi:pimeloyl-ACP methyl ester carboxylesterase
MDAPGPPTVARVERDDGIRIHALVWDPPAVAGAPAAGARPAVATAPAPPFLLVHGLASNALLWSGVAASLAAAGHRVVAVDQRGHGRSDPSDDLRLATLGADLVAVTAALGLARPIAVGQSWGGNVVLELARRHPGAVRAVVGVDGGTIELAERFADRDACWAALAPPDWDRERMTPTTALAGLVARHPHWPEAGRGAQLGNLAVRADGTVTAILTRARHRMIVDGLYDHRPSEVLDEVDVPVLLLPVTADEHAIERACRRLRNGRAVWLAGHDHDVHAEAPQLVADVLLTEVSTGFLDPGREPAATRTDAEHL